MSAAGPDVGSERSASVGGRSPFFRTVRALVWRDLLAEYRSREVLGGGIVFALLTLVVFNFKVTPALDGLRVQMPARQI